MSRDATTPEDYIASVPEKHRPIVEQLRALVRDNLPDGYVEVMRWGMINYEVPLNVSGKTYNGQPLQYIAIGAKKAHVGLYHMGLYANPEAKAAFVAAYEDAGVKLDMGGSCVRIKKPEGIHREAIAKAVTTYEVVDFVAVSAR